MGIQNKTFPDLANELCKISVHHFLKCSSKKDMCPSSISCFCCFMRVWLLELQQPYLVGRRPWDWSHMCCSHRWKKLTLVGLDQPWTVTPRLLYNICLGFVCFFFQCFYGSLLLSAEPGISQCNCLRWNLLYLQKSLSHYLPPIRKFDQLFH